MIAFDNFVPTAELQAADAAHHMHPFSHGGDLNARGARIITDARGCWLTDSTGEEISDAMAGLWCVNIGYGRKELARAAAAQMERLPYYNIFFRTSHPPAIALSRRPAELAPYLAEKWAVLADHPLVGEARTRGMMGAIELTPDKAARAAFASPAGTVGHRCRERCFANNPIMRHVGDAMIASPPPVIGMDEIDILTERAWCALDETLIGLRADDLMRIA